MFISKNKGIAFPVILVILALLGVGGGVGYTQIKKVVEKRRIKYEEEQKIVKEKDAKEAAERAEKEKMEMEKKKVLEEKELREKIFAKAQVIDLKDVIKGKSTGKAWLAVYEGKTYHRIKSSGLPKPEGANFFEGWLVKDAKKVDFFSTGKIDWQNNGDGILDFITDGDKTIYRTVVLTSESNDGNPKQDKHIQEGTFSFKLKNSDFVVVLKDILTKESVNSADKNYSGTILAGKTSLLLNFNMGDYEKALKSNKTILLYFYANWCPICKEETSNALYPYFNELNNPQVIGFRVNYNDNETDNNEKSLAREFGVAYQHTKVILKNGQRVLKSPESWNKNKYLTEINKNLNQ